MKDTTGKNERNGRRKPADRELEDALERSMPSYTPEHRRTVLKGLRILARVAIRSYIQEQAVRSRDKHGGEEEGPIECEGETKWDAED